MAASVVALWLLAALAQLNRSNNDGLWMLPR
jgi:hypothetical protein